MPPPDTRCISGPPGNPSPQDSGRLVERLPSGVVPRPSNQSVVAVALHQQQVRVASGRDQARYGEPRVIGRIRLRQPGGIDMGLEVIDPK